MIWSGKRNISECDRDRPDSIRSQNQLDQCNIHLTQALVKFLSCDWSEGGIVERQSGTELRVKSKIELRAKSKTESRLDHRADLITEQGF